MGTLLSSAIFSLSEQKYLTELEVLLSGEECSVTVTGELIFCESLTSFSDMI